MNTDFELQDWVFDIQEKSSGVYEISGKHVLNHAIVLQQNTSGGTILSRRFDLSAVGSRLLVAVKAERQNKQLLPTKSRFPHVPPNCFFRQFNSSRNSR